MTTIEVPRDTEKGKKNPAITILCDELVLSIFDKDTEGKAYHILDVVNKVFPTLRHSYPEIKTKAQTYIYVFWSLKSICWNNRAKLVEQDWFEAPGTATEAINDHLPEGSRWEARVPSKFGHQTTEQKKAWVQAVEMAQWAVNHLKGWFPTWDDQRIIDLLYNPDNGTKYAPRSVETALKLRRETI